MVELESCQQSNIKKTVCDTLLHIVYVCVLYVRRKDFICNITTFSPVLSMDSDSWGVQGDKETAWTLESDRSEFTPLICYYLFPTLGKVFPVSSTMQNKNLLELLGAETSV